MQSSSKLPNQEQKYCSDTNQFKAIMLDSLSEDDKLMIEKYQSEIKDGTLTIYGNSELKSLDFIRVLNLNQLSLEYCEQITPKLESLTIKKLKIIECYIQSVKGFQLDNLEVLEIYNTQYILESKTLAQEILQFKKLKILILYQWKVDVSPLQRMTRLTKLRLMQCNLRSTEALRPLINLQELYLDGNDIDITTVQYLTNLTNLSLRCCNLVNLDVLRPLKKLEELDIFNNQTVYLQPLMELKQLSKLNASFNKIIDAQSIQHHPNFDSYNLDDQDKPTQEQLQTANILRDINSPISSLKQMNKKLSRIKEKSTVFRKKINQQLQDSYNSRERFVARAAILFQKMNVFDSCQ
ncbi:NEAT_domain-containing protein [Hexamita inflata]|uniref:NEAT domain-containing protein n=1 Tax=Hexamita inflata TaxID=28002 RepID=A0AA86NFL0_9EUKA|nr:NEAT domain-containing protein [Hexamita inflata]